MPEEKLTLEQLGQKIKTKYPQYKDMSDTELANKMIEKFPVYKDMVISEAAPEIKKKEQVTELPSKDGSLVQPKSKADANNDNKSLGTPTGEQFTYAPEAFSGNEVKYAPTSKANKPIVKKPEIKPKEEYVYYEPDIYSEEVLAPKSRANKPAVKVESKFTLSNEEFNKRITTITPDLVRKEEEFTVPQLNYQFKDFGFKFEETGLGDAVSVTAPNGKRTTISLGRSADRDLQKFLKDNGGQYDKLAKSITNQENYNKTFVDQKEIEASFLKIQQDQNEFTKSVQDLYKTPKGTQEYNTKLAELQKKQTLIEGSKKDLSSSVGKYVTMKSSQGETSEYLWNQLMDGLTSAASGTAGLMIDAFAPSNMTDSEKKAAKKWIQPILRESLDFAKSESTTKEYAANVGFIEGAVGGLVKSLPAMLAAEAMPLIMAAQISDDLDVQMDSDPNFKNISENEKLFLKVPMMVGGAVLETYGFRNAIGTKGLLNDLVASAIGKSTKSTTTKTFKEFIEQDIESRIAKGAIKIGAGGLAEFETGASQELLDITTKDIYNAAKGKDMFQAPNTFGEGAKQVLKAGLQEAIGGFILSTPSAFSKAKKTNNYSEVTDGQIEVLKNLGNDANVITAIETDLQNKVNLGELTPIEAEEQLNDTRESVGVLNSINTEGMTPEQIKRALPIAKKLRDLKNKTDGKVNQTEADKFAINELKVSLDKITNEVKDQTPVADLIDKKVSFQGEEGVIVKDEGGKLTFETPNKIIELQGDEMANAIALPKIEVKGNNVKIDDELFNILSTNKNDNGDVVSVTLRNKEGQVITNKDADLATEISKQFKNKKDAIQEQTTEESVLRNQQPEMGLQEMGEGDTQETSEQGKTKEIAGSVGVGGDVKAVKTIDNGKVIVEDLTNNLKTKEDKVKALTEKLSSINYANVENNIEEFYSTIAERYFNGEERYKEVVHTVLGEYDIAGPGITKATEQSLKETPKEEVKPFSIDNKTKFYHATPSKIEGKLKVSNAPQFGTGIYLASDKKTVEGEFGDNVMELELNLSNPVYTNTKNWNEVESEAIRLADEEYGKKNNLTLGEDDTYFRYDPENLSEIDEIPSKHISDAAKKLGYDAIVDKGSRTYGDEIVVLDESKIIYPKPIKKQNNETENENGIQKRGTQGNENVPGKVQGQREKGGEDVNVPESKTKEEVKPTELQIKISSLQDKIETIKKGKEGKSQILQKIADTAIFDLQKKLNTLINKQNEAETKAKAKAKKADVLKGKPKSAVVETAAEKVKEKPVTNPRANKGEDVIWKDVNGKRGQGTVISVSKVGNSFEYEIKTKQGAVTTKKHSEIKKKGIGVLANTIKKYSNLDVLTPRTLILRYFATGGKVLYGTKQQDGALSQTGYAAEDLFGFISKNGRTYSQLYENIMDELQLEDFDQGDFNTMVSEILQGGKQSVYDEIKTHLVGEAKDLDDPINWSYNELLEVVGNENFPNREWIIEQIGEQERAIVDELSETELAELDKNIEKYTVNGITDWDAIANDNEVQQLESNKNENTENLLKGAVTKNGDSTPIGQEEKTGQQEIENIKENESNYILTPNKDLPFLSESGNDNYPTKGDLQREEDNSQGYSRSIIGVWNKTKDLQFTGTTKVRNAEDVAHIMRLLENKNVEHGFAVHVDAKGNSHIQYLSVGGTTGTVIDSKLVLAGLAKFKSKKVYLVHNHPSGALVPSKPDISITQTLQSALGKLDIDLEHVIMDTYSNKYVLLDKDADFTVEDRNKDLEDNSNLTVHVFNEQKVISIPQTKVTSSKTAAEFIQQLRFTAMPKNAMLLLSQNNDIIGNYVFKDKITYQECVDFIGKSGIGTSVIFYGNQQRESEAREVSDFLKKMSVNVLDHIITDSNGSDVVGYYRSLGEEGMLEETQTEYGTNSVSEPNVEIIDANAINKVLLHTNIQTLKGHPHYKKAKSGNVKLAYLLSVDLIKPEKLFPLKENPTAIIVPVRAIEQDGVNAIPLAMAKIMSEIFGNKIDLDIYQSNKPKHTGKSKLARMTSPPEFLGKIQKGLKYFLVDDVATSGSTLNNLKNYIEDNGGIVVGSTAIAVGRGGGKIGITDLEVKKINAKFGKSNINTFLKEYGIAESSEKLTSSQANDLLRFGTIDKIRNKLLVEGIGKARERVEPLDSEKQQNKVTESEISSNLAAIIKDTNVTIKKQGVEGKLLNEQEAKDLKKEIISKRAPKGKIIFGQGYLDDNGVFREAQDIRQNVFNYSQPYASKNINGIDVRIVDGLIRKNKDGKKYKTYLLYADGKIVGEFNSVADAKSVVGFIEDNLVKELPISKQKELSEQKIKELAAKIRSKKLSGLGVHLDFGITKTIYNGALEIAAREVEKGSKLGNAINKAIQWVDSKVGKNWNKGLFAKHLNDKYKVTLNGKEVEVEVDNSKPTAELINGFYSPLEDGIVKSKLDKATGRDWLKRLQGETESDELKWTGVADYLTENSDNIITKNNLLDYFKTNRIEIVEVTKIDASEGAFRGWTDVRLENHLINEMGADPEEISDMSRSEMITWANENGDRDYLGTGDTKFVQYQLEGQKENYKEVFVTLPVTEREKTINEKDKKTLADYVNSIRELNEFYANNKRFNDITAEDDLDYVYIQYVDERNDDILKKIAFDDIVEITKSKKAAKEYIEKRSKFIKPIDTIGMSTKANTIGSFSSSHFDEPNILVHLRMNTRTDAQGNKVLFLEEVQSDWGQTGKKEGFATNEKPKEVKVKDLPNLKIEEEDFWDSVSISASEPNSNISRALGRVTNIGKNKYEAVQLTEQGVETKIGEYRTRKEATNAILESKIFEGADKKTISAIPSAPFVMDTNAWTKLGLKVALKEAIKQGADKIAWTTGEQQNDRYDLSKSVKRVDFIKVGEDRYKYEALDLNSKRIAFDDNGTTSLKDIENMFGKDIAEKVKADKKGDLRLEGEGLKVGGKGMKGFYGSPTEGKLGIVGEVARSLTGQSPKTIEINKGKNEKLKAYQYDGTQDVSGMMGRDYLKKGDWIIETPSGFQMSFDTKSKEDALREFRDATEDTGSNVGEYSESTQYSIDITPELKESVESGIPLFKGLTPKEQSKQRIEAAKKAFIEKSKNMSSGGFQALPEFVELIKSYIADGIITAKEFIERFKDELPGVDLNEKLAVTQFDKIYKKATTVVDETTEEVKKTIATSRVYEGNVRAGVKRELEKLGLTRDVENQQEAKERAIEFVNTVGVETALEAVRNNDVSDAAGAYVWNEILERLDRKISKEKDSTKLAELEKEQAGLFNEFSRKALSGGRFSSALADIYQNSDIGYNVENKIQEYRDANNGQISEEVEEKFRELDAQYKEVKQKLAEAEERAIKAEGELAIKNIQEAAARTPKQKVTVSSKIRTETDWIVSRVKEAQLNRPGMFLSATPASLVWDGAVKIVAGTIKVTGRSAEAIAKGLEHIVKSDWYKSLSDSDKKEAEKQFSEFWVNKETIPGIAIKIPNGLIRRLVEEGATTIEEVVEGVKDVIKEEYPDITDREIRDAITQYGKIKNLSKDEILASIRKIKRIGRIVSALEDVNNKKRPLRSGLQRDKLDAQERALNKELRELMKELPIDAELEAKQQKTALDATKQRITNQIEDLQREIDKGMRVPLSKRSMAEDAELTNLKEKRDKLKIKHDEIFKDESFLQAKRLDATKKASQRAINDLRRRLKEKDFTKKEKSPLIKDSELLNLQAEKLRLREEYDKEIYKAKLNNRTKAEKTIDALWNAWGLTRLLRATGEFSFVGIQGLVLSISNPTYALKSFMTAMKFFGSESRTENWLNMIKSQEWYPEMRQSKLSISEPRGEATAREELFLSDAANFVWNILGSALKLKSKSAYDNWKRKSPFKAFERAAVGYLDTMRVLKFLDGREMLHERGIRFENDPQAFKDLADVVNTFTGRASIGPLEQIAPTLTKVFFSPRNWASALKQTILFPRQLYKWRNKSGTPGVSIANKIALLDYSKFIGLTMGLVIAAAMYYNDDDDDETGVETDPTSSDFGKIKIGNTRVDPWGGRIQQIVFLARMIAGSILKGSGEVVKLGTPYRAPTRLGLIGEQATNKLAPSASMIQKFLTTHEKNGVTVDQWGNPYSITEELKKNSYPIYWDTVKDLLQDDPTALDGLLAFYAFFGGGVNVYDKKTKPLSNRPIKELKELKEVQEVKGL